ncbi:hypothetical protein [Clostridium luticellarii]|jgi:hypothetical protein|uniref:Sporulation protein Cse60 n=1 Tax=Clostridium luticellarii TaxID=1691940 RepID=A0A2T0BLX7_9CLOT|nr:hypothetical protein [Clostridium luticellarii]MCI1996213.1 hypothetical protein [Clostridium luticellarii]PRR84869.1 hypothetical protein CLLU_21340 [Clostridium luticellarii]
MIAYRSNVIEVKGLCENTLKKLENKIRDTLENDLKSKIIIDIKYAQTQYEYTALIIYHKGY